MRRIAYVAVFVLILATIIMQTGPLMNVQQDDLQAEISQKAMIPDSKCNIQVRAENMGPLPLSLQLIESSVRVEYGKWNSLYYNIGGGALCSMASITLAKSSSKGQCQCHFLLDCSIPRQYRFQVVQTTKEGTEEVFELFFPSDSTFTTQDEIELQIHAQALSKL